MMIKLAGAVPARAGLTAAPMLSAPAGDPATAAPLPTGQQPVETPSPDPLDRIAKLARLRDSGALTDEEFETQKAKLLAET